MPARAQGLRAALNAALFRTGDQSRDFAVVLATNRPADLDPAVLDRIDEALEFPLPGRAERRRILQIYLDSYLARAGTEAGARGSEKTLLACLLCREAGCHFAKVESHRWLRETCARRWHHLPLLAGGPS